MDLDLILLELGLSPELDPEYFLDLVEDALVEGVISRIAIAAACGHLEQAIGQAQALLRDRKDEQALRIAKRVVEHSKVLVKKLDAGDEGNRGFIGRLNGLAHRAEGMVRSLEADLRNHVRDANNYAMA